jgi:hypothetical protein
MIMTMGLKPIATTDKTTSYEHTYSTKLVMNDVI